MTFDRITVKQNKAICARYTAKNSTTIDRNSFSFCGLEKKKKKTASFCCNMHRVRIDLQYLLIIYFFIFYLLFCNYIIISQFIQSLSTVQVHPIDLNKDSIHFACFLFYSISFVTRNGYSYFLFIFELIHSFFIFLYSLHSFLFPLHIDLVVNLLQLSIQLSIMYVYSIYIYIQQFEEKKTNHFLSIFLFHFPFLSFLFL